MLTPNLGQPGRNPDDRRPERIVHVHRPRGSRFLHWALAILLVLVALGVLALWLGAVSLQHVAQSTQQIRAYHRLSRLLLAGRTPRSDVASRR